MTTILVAEIVRKHVVHEKHGRAGNTWFTRVVQAKYEHTESVWLAQGRAVRSYVDYLSCHL